MEGTWTKGPLAILWDERDEVERPWWVVDSKDDLVAEFRTESDARLFVAARGLYEALEVALLTLSSFEEMALSHGMTDVAREIGDTQEYITFKMKIANPGLFSQNPKEPGK